MKCLPSFSAAALAALMSLPAAAAPPKPAPAAPAAMHGTVTGVIDGDTLQFTPAGQAPMTVRLRDIDAPEICQAWGPESKRALTELAQGKAATLRIAGRDGRGPALGMVLVDDINLSTQMVEDGHAWSVRTRFDNGPLVKQERMSKALGRGFHTQPGKERPWDFRKTHGPCPA